MNIRYSLRSLCRCLEVTRNRIYYQPQLISKKTDKMLSEKVKVVFNGNYQAYGARRLQTALKKQDIHLSSLRIARIMKK
jgi:putative transposase